MARIIVAHPGQGFGKTFCHRWVEVRSSREHAMIEGWRSPDFNQRSFRHQSFAFQCLPKWAAHRSRIGSAVKNRANHFRLASAGIPMLADIAVEAQRAILLFFDQTFALEKMNRQDPAVAPIAASSTQGATFCT